MRRNKKKTQEEYVVEVAIINPNIEVVGEYIDSKTSILHKCKVDGYEWYARPTNILNGRGCPECANKNRAIKNGISREEYMELLFVKNPTIEIIGEYINARTKTLHHCLIHDIYWDAIPDKVLNEASGCSECKKEKFRVSRTKTRDEYIAELSTINPNIELTGEYTNCKTPTEHYCKIHKIFFDIAPQSTLQGHGCRGCASDKIRMKKLKTEDEYISELAEKNPNVRLIGRYHDSLTPTEHLCLIHNVIWKPTPARVLGGGGCQQCGSEKISNYFLKPKEQYIAELAVRNPDVELIGEYAGGKVPTEHYCKIHDELFLTSPDCALRGCGCLHCRGSKGEKYIGEWLDNHNIIYESQKSFVDCKDKQPLPFDFYLPDYNCCIEYDGKQHFEPIEWFGGQESLEYTQKHDNIKNEYCQNNNIKLLRIPYYTNIEEELNNFLFI